MVIAEALTASDNIGSEQLLLAGPKDEVATTLSLDTAAPGQ